LRSSSSSGSCSETKALVQAKIISASQDLAGSVAQFSQPRTQIVSLPACQRFILV
jgi:hypothetical protein